MSEQLNFFDENNITIIDGGAKSNPLNVLKCYESKLQNICYHSFEELFSGFNTIKAITFSYDIDFINKIIKYFDYGEIILGADFLVQKDKKINELMAEVFANSYEAGQAIRKHERLINMIQKENLNFHTPTFVLDHRKIYLLKSDDGRTRVIKTSANMSNRAWSGDQMEIYDYDNSLYCYEEFEKDFETMWENSIEIPLSVISSKKADDLVEGNAILKSVKESGNTVVLQQTEELTYERVKYTIDHEALREEYKALIDGVKTKNKNNLIEIIPKTIEKIEHNKKKIFQKIKVDTVTKQYPSMSIDCYNKEVVLDGEKLDLRPSEKEIKNDIDTLLNMFENFNEFVGNTEKLKETHFKLINAIFSAPFNAKLRCASFIKGIPTKSFPLFLLIVSRTANCGKTFTISAALKMMTGKELLPANKEDCKKDDIRTIQIGNKCVPVFIDELDNKYLSNIKDIIKHPEKCEHNQLEEQPTILFASNDCIEPDEILRKRMVFLRFEGALPSNIDQVAYTGKGNAIKKKLGTGFYREYLRRMLDKVKNELDYIIYTKDEDRPDEYYPDLMAMSSDVILSIFHDYNYELPKYIKHLSWNEDYSINASFIADNTINEIGEFYKQNKQAFFITRDNITIELGADKNSSKKCESWKNTLPPEMQVQFIATRDSCKITINRKELETRLGYKLGKFSLFKRN